MMAGQGVLAMLAGVLTAAGALVSALVLWGRQRGDSHQARVKNDLRYADMIGAKLDAALARAEAAENRVHKLTLHATELHQLLILHPPPGVRIPDCPETEGQPR